MDKEKKGAHLEYARLYFEEKELEEQLQKVRQRKAVMEEMALLEFSELGATSLRETKLGYTLYLKREIYGSLKSGADGSKKEAIEALKNSPHSWLVKEAVNARDLKRWIKEEYEEKNKELEEELGEWIKIDRKIQVMVRKH